MEKEDHSTFYDVHMHAYNLSHPGLLLFANRFLRNIRLTFSDLTSLRLFSLMAKILIKKEKGHDTVLRKRIAGYLFLILLVSPLVLFVLSLLAGLLVAGLITVILLILSILFLLPFLIDKLNNGLKPGTIKSALNMFSLFENDLARQFRYLELDYMSLNPAIEIAVGSFAPDIAPAEINNQLKEIWEGGAVNKKFRINGEFYSKVVLTPLIMDFGFKGFEKENFEAIHYKLQPRKAVLDQTHDLFRGIWNYYNYSNFDLLNIYPFLGINPVLYKDEQEITKVLDKYFKQFSSEDTKAGRTELLENKRIAFAGSGSGSDDSFYYFAGIKLYPPLGFNPWPKDNDYKNIKGINIDKEQAKVEALYDYCIGRKIPVTVHCSDGGFKVIDRQEHNAFTSPGKWRRVLENKRGLTLNLAHAGFQSYNMKPGNHWGGWLKIILEMIKTGGEAFQNLYLDISDLGGPDASYEKFCEAIGRFKKLLPVSEQKKFTETLNAKILFGTDFMVNLFHLGSYLEHLGIFSETKAFDNIKLDKDKFCTTNAEMFLFG